MTDAELLELAASAAGVAIDETDADGTCWVSIGPDGRGQPMWKGWNPLRYDADALRLATALGLSVEPYPYYSTPKHSVIVKQRRRGDQMRESNPTEVVERYGDDRDAATRRAIVRSAAMIPSSARHTGEGDA